MNENDDAGQSCKCHNPKKNKNFFLNPAFFLHLVVKTPNSMTAYSNLGWCINLHRHVNNPLYPNQLHVHTKNHYVKKQTNYMPLHKLNHAKNTSHQLKKIYVHFQIYFLFKSIGISPPIYKPQICAHTPTHACAQIAHTGTFRQTNVSLAGVKLWHFAVCVCTCNYMMSKKKGRKTHTHTHTQK